MTDVTLDGVKAGLEREGFLLLDVRSLREYTGDAAAPCDPRPGRIPGARHLDVSELMTLTAEEIAERIGPPGGEVVTYCHSGQRSELAAEILRAAGYDAANYRGSWHEWSRYDSLPVESG